MNALFFDTEKKPEQYRPGSYVEPDTGAVVWTLQKEVAGVCPELTLQDRRELAKTGLKDDKYFAQAKRVFAAGGRTKAIRNACGRSPSYAKKVYAAFRRANKDTDKKRR